MGRQKRTSRALKNAEHRYAGLYSIDQLTSLDNKINLEDYKDKIEALRNELKNYNAILSSADRAANIVNQLETELNNLSEQMLLGVAAHFGKDSHEYEMAGGTRKSERRRPSRSSKNTDANKTAPQT